MARKDVTHVLHTKGSLDDRDSQITERRNNCDDSADDETVGQVERFGPSESGTNSYGYDDTSDVPLDGLLW